MRDLLRLLALVIVIPVAVLLIGPALVLAAARRRQRLGPITLTALRGGRGGRLATACIGLALWAGVWGGLTLLVWPIAGPTLTSLSAAPPVVAQAEPPTPAAPLEVTTQVRATEPTLPDMTTTSPATAASPPATTATPTPTTSATGTDTPAPTPTVTDTATPPPTATATDTPTPTPTPTYTLVVATAVPPTQTPSPTPTVRPTDTPWPTPTLWLTATPPPTATASPTHTPTPPPPPTATATAATTSAATAVALAVGSATPPEPLPTSPPLAPQPLPSAPPAPAPATLTPTSALPVLLPFADEPARAAIAAVESANELLRLAIEQPTAGRLAALADHWQDTALPKAQAFARAMHYRVGKPVTASYVYLVPPTASHDAAMDRVSVDAIEVWTYQGRILTYTEHFQFNYTLAQQDGRWVIVDYTYRNAPTPPTPVGGKS